MYSYLKRTILIPYFFHIYLTLFRSSKSSQPATKSRQSKSASVQCHSGKWNTMPSTTSTQEYNTPLHLSRPKPRTSGRPTDWPSQTSFTHSFGVRGQRKTISSTTSTQEHNTPLHLSRPKPRTRGRPTHRLAKSNQPASLTPSVSAASGKPYPAQQAHGEEYYTLHYTLHSRSERAADKTRA